MARVLIVDNEPDIVALITRYAQREGYDVTTAQDGEEAVTLCKSEDFDIKM